MFKYLLNLNILNNVVPLFKSFFFYITLFSIKVCVILVLFFAGIA